MQKTLLAAARFIGIGWYIGLCIALGVFGGRWIGQKVGSEVFFTLLGLMIGLVVAAYGIWASYALLAKSNDSKPNDKNGER